MKESKRELLRLIISGISLFSGMIIMLMLALIQYTKEWLPEPNQISGIVFATLCSISIILFFLPMMFYEFRCFKRI